MTNLNDWLPLITQAKKAASNAYAPYSNFHVGAAAIDSDNNTYTGCNVENASYGLTVCAERNFISFAVNQKSTNLKALLVYTQQEKLTPPCGACRQVIAEFLSQDALVASANHLDHLKVWTVAELLPDAFTPQLLT
ncbi:MAG: cytidine deaminase [Saccharospirillaceae bacterium]|nr:cytidine deaminase [Colwellia sp.]NRB77228.1 cytidine deaminase [Saccharospirillaceae bacterium]